MTSTAPLKEMIGGFSSLAQLGVGVESEHSREVTEEVHIPDQGI